MERKKTPKLVITFPTTTAAMAMEAACGPELGRLIPIPRSISAGCGLAWCAPPEQEKDLERILEENRIPRQEKRIIDLY